MLHNEARHRPALLALGRFVVTRLIIDPNWETESKVGGEEPVMAALDLSKLVKERRFRVASFFVASAAALQVSILLPSPLLSGHMMCVCNVHHHG
jgi:hypothetical protein